jgi:hypothetical protein
MGEKVDFFKAAFKSQVELGLGKIFRTASKEDQGAPEIKWTEADCESGYFYRVIENKHATAHYTYWQNITNLSEA